MKLVRRLGAGPKISTSRNKCPDIWELESGDFAVVGADATDELKGKIEDKDKPGFKAAVADDERIVVIPRHLLISAKKDIPKE